MTTPTPQQYIDQARDLLKRTTADPALSAGHAIDRDKARAILARELEARHEAQAATTEALTAQRAAEKRADDASGELILERANSRRLERNLTSYKSVLALAQDAKLRAERNLTNSDTARKDYGRRIDAMSAELAEARATIADQAESIRRGNAHNLDKAAEQEKLERDLARAKDLARKLRQHNLTLAAKVTEYSDEAIELGEKLGRTDRQLDTETRRSAILRAERDNAREALTTANSFATGTLERETDTRRRREEQLGNSARDLREAKAKLDRAYRQRDEWQQEAENVATELGNVKRNLRAAIDRNVTLTRERDELKVIRATDQAAGRAASTSLAEQLAGMQWASVGKIDSDDPGLDKLRAYYDGTSPRIVIGPSGTAAADLEAKALAELKRNPLRLMPIEDDSDTVAGLRTDLNRTTEVLRLERIARKRAERKLARKEHKRAGTERQLNRAEKLITAQRKALDQARGQRDNYARQASIAREHNSTDPAAGLKVAAEVLSHLAEHPRNIEVGIEAEAPVQSWNTMAITRTGRTALTIKAEQ